ncbi:hypothetical protein [Rhodoferax sp.]|uniref:hypothetical protein n=1 Tax=Rhodoferax sp. TaxID=50421 RepID=UPI002ACE3A04|nr:hypothetical protein [Rhodoferax sp.]MDZ7919782.1 hypothetical protein [Rhodoferax sp.]
MQLQKTDKARAELQGGSRTLGQRQRALLILADGKNTVHAVEHLFNGQAQTLAHELIAAGYLVGINLERPSAAHPMAKPAPPKAVAEQVTLPSNAADSFEGKRSLATTRMFLFDICERMFVRRAPEQAEAFRDALRNAKDRDSMLAAARDMIAAVETIAGHERADSISERIAMLLPPED